MRVCRNAAVNSVRLAVLVVLIAMQPMVARSEPTGARYQVDQPSRPVADALTAIARQTNVSVLFDSSVVSARRSRPVTGQFTGAEAISKALEGTGLTAEVMRDGSVVVKPIAAPGSQSSTDSKDVISANADPIRLAQAPIPAQGSSEADVNKPTPERLTPQKLLTVEVTGSRIKRVDTQGALPVNVYSREDIDRSGQSSVADFLKTLNEISISGSDGSTPSGKQGTVQLRGLPIGTTLVLINGRRLQSSGSSADGSFFNLDQIPLAAIDRIEVLPVGSSAVYGGDALAGVVNIVLKKSFSGWAVDSRYAVATGTEDGSLSLTTGGNFERGSFLLVATGTKRTPLTMGERDFFKDADYRRFGGTDARTRTCAPGTVTSASGANLPGLNSPLAGIPAVGDRPLTPGDFAPTDGVPNLCAPLVQGGPGIPLLFKSETSALHSAVEYQLKDTFSVFAELTYSDLKIEARQSGPALSNVLVPAANPFNPFGVDVRVTTRLAFDNAPMGTATDVEYRRALVGTRLGLSENWELEATASTTRDKGSITPFNSQVNFAARAAALAASTAEAALNPFATGRAASDEVLRSIWADARNDFAGARDNLDVFVRGSPFRLPAGSVDLIAGAEWGEDRWRFIVGTPGGDSLNLSRRVNSQFAEARLPLLSGESQGRRLERATLLLAGRSDKYAGTNAEQTYQAGLELRPIRTTLLRAAHATSFKPATLLQLAPVPQSFTTDVFGLTDPQSNNDPIVGGEVFLGPNQNLQPQTGRAQTLGLLWEPESLDGLRMGLTAWRIRLRDQVFLPDSPQLILDNESLFPGYVTRGPSPGGTPGPVTRVFWTFLNFGQIDVEGTDADIAYAFRTPVGRFNLAAGATRTSKYEVKLMPGTPIDNRLSKLNNDFWAPKWKGRLSVGFDRAPWSVGVTGRYFGSYQDAGTSTRELGDTWLFDLAAGADLKKLLPWGSGGVKSAVLSLGIVNVADKLPEYANTFFFYDISNADWRGRYTSLRLSVAF